MSFKLTNHARPGIALILGALGVLGAGALFWSAGCQFAPNAKLSGGGGTGGGPIPGLTALKIAPATTTLTAKQGGAPQTQQLTVTGTVNGGSRDVTHEVTYSVTPSGIVSVSASGLVTTGQAGGSATVTATSGAIAATAKVEVTYAFTGADPGMTSMVPADADAKFAATSNDASRAPKLVYPNDGVLFPPNVSGVEIHFTPGANNTLFEVSAVGTLATFKIYIRCTTPAGITGCIYTPAAALWRAIAASNAGQPAVQLTVRGTDDAGTTVGTSASTRMTFSRDDIQGALYYWTTSGSTAIMRWDFAGSVPTAQPYLTPANGDGKTCVGCHALSLDGTKVVASVGGQSDGRLLLWDIAQDAPMQPFPLAQKSQFESWNAGGTQFVGVYGDATKHGPVNLMLFDGTSGQVAGTIDLGGLRADHPDWTKSTVGPDTIAFTSIDAVATTTDQRPATGGISLVQSTGGAWGAPQVLIPSQLGKNRYYPAISPDGAVLIYDESTCANYATAGQSPDKSCDADTDATATVFMAQLPPAAPAPVALANANAPGVGDNGNTKLTNSFPKWAPFVSQLDEFHKQYWFTFSSTRQYGLRNPPVPASTDETNKGTLIWMVGVRVGLAGQDASYTAFCLPFQDPTTSNHIAQWTKVFIQGPS